MTAGIQALVAGGGPRIALSSTNVDATAIDPSDATAAYTLENDGDILSTVNGVVTDLGDWMSPKIASLAANYEVMATVTGGSVSGGTTGSWLNLGSNRSWTRAQTSAGSSFATLTVQIRRTGTATVLASATIDLSAQVDT
jgi:hypothetical protein